MISLFPLLVVILKLYEGFIGTCKAPRVQEGLYRMMAETLGSEVKQTHV